ncbi:MAG: thioredoxin family protein [Methylococcaceae bacterium]|nr:thioredoxin family protein [Methylococcaceae bacterium]
MFFITSSSVFAGAKAEIQVRVVDNHQWPAQYQISLTPPLQHHAYLDKGVENAYIPIVIDPKNELVNQGLVMSQFALPQGEFDSEVQATVLRGQGNIALSLMPGNNYKQVATTANLSLRYQLCDEISNVCFRPQTVEITLQLPALGAVRGSLDEGEADQTWMEQLLSVFNNNQSNSLLLFSLMLLAGMLSVATPCVYPMLPITSMLIVKRAQGIQNKEKYHALVYLVGMVGTYVILGVAAGMTGGAFNSFMQSATVNLVFAVFFAFFAISLLGYYEFSFMQNEVGQLDQNTDKVNGYLGTWMMGSIAGLVISPCVGPIVFALLLQVADNIAAQADALAAMGQTLSFWDKLSISLQGGLLMGGFGLGISLPFFLVSVIKFKKLPRSGYWMNKVKYAFGFAILYFAYTYFHKGMGVLQVSEEVTLMLAWGLVALWVAIVHLNILSAAEHDHHPSRRLNRFAGVVSFILGGWLLVSGLNHMPIIGIASATTVDESVAQQHTLDDTGGIAWLHSFTAAQQQAKASGKPIFIDFYASWCANCLAFAKEAVNDEALNQALREQSIPLKIIDKTPEFETFKQSAEHRQLKIGLPYFAILDSHGVLQWSGTDYKAKTTMINVLQRLNRAS